MCNNKLILILLSQFFNSSKKVYGKKGYQPPSLVQVYQGWRICLGRALISSMGTTLVCPWVNTTPEPPPLRSPRLGTETSSRTLVLSPLASLRRVSSSLAWWRQSRPLGGVKPSPCPSPATQPRFSCQVGILFIIF